jgi:predicted glycosyltransferase
MNVIIDISHPAQLNFFKNAIQLLSRNGDAIILTSIKRGKLPDIIAKELPGLPVTYVGRHRGNKLSIIFEANLFKFIRLLFFLLNRKVYVGASVGGFVLGAALKFYFKPNIQFDDDPESAKNFFLGRLTGSELFLPLFGRARGKIKIFGALKEWAYLSPKYFKADLKVLTRYDLTPYKYIFVREISTGSLNYEDQDSNLIAKVADDFPKGCKVLLSLEDKTTQSKYPKDWILLEEPIDDIHSLIFFSKLLVSSGDSMAREGAMLGVPSIYCGTREMAANKVMINKGLLFHKDVKELPQFVLRITENDIKFEKQDQFRERLEGEWEDVTEFIMKQIKKYG